MTASKGQVQAEPTEILAAEQELSNQALALLQKPSMAIPTVLLFVVALSTTIGTAYIHYLELISNLTCQTVMVIAMIGLFTVGHDAAHGSLSKFNLFNAIIARISFWCLGPIALFPCWRFIHLEHHKHTNNPEKDPDNYSATGYTFLLPFKWFTQIVFYAIYYFSIIEKRPGKEIAEFFSLAIVNFYGSLMLTHWGYGYLVWNYWILPSTFCHFFLVFLFDYLPHHGHSATPQEDRYHTTSMLVFDSVLFFLQPILSVLMQFQDYHLVHHLYPSLPFYRYKDMWNAKKDFLVHQKHVSVRPYVFL